MDEYLTMTAAKAIEHVCEVFDMSKYALAKALSDKSLTVQSIQISNYLGSKHRKKSFMSKKVAQRFFETYGIVISDAHDPRVEVKGQHDEE